jgi:hypothetical protein
MILSQIFLAVDLQIGSPERGRTLEGVPLDKAKGLCYNSVVFYNWLDLSSSDSSGPSGMDERYGEGSNSFARHCAKEAAFSVAPLQAQGTCLFLVVERR